MPALPSLTVTKNSPIYMTAKLKLLFLIEHLKHGSGLENSAIRIGLALSKLGHEIHVCCNTADEFETIYIHHSLGDADAVIKKITPDLVIDWGFFKKADLHVMGQGTHRGYLSHYIDAFHGALRIIKQLDFKRKKHQNKIRKQEEFLHNQDAFFWANSKQTQAMAVDGGAAVKKVKFYHETVNFEKFDIEKTKVYRQDIRKKWGLKETDIAFLFVAHNLKLKNLSLLLKIFRRLESKKAKLVVVGKRCIKKRPDFLIYAGMSSEMEKIYAAGDVLLHPTFFDSCANVVLEAMSSSLPVVVSNTAGINEVIRDKKDGWVLPVRGINTESLWTEKINELMNAETRKSMGRSARETAETRNFESFIRWFDDYLETIYCSKTNK